MSRTWKWILGIVAVLLIIGVAAAAVFVWWNHAPLVARRVVTLPPVSGTPVPNAPNSQQPSQQNPLGPYAFRQKRRSFGYGWDNRMPMMGGRGFRNFGGFPLFGMGFFFLGGLLRLIIPLGVLILVAILFYQLGKRAGATSSVSALPSSPASPQTPPGRKVAKS